VPRVARHCSRVVGSGRPEAAAAAPARVVGAVAARARIAAQVAVAMRIIFALTVSARKREATSFDTFLTAMPVAYMLMLPALVLPHRLPQPTPRVATPVGAS
jgi:hypothetical protein